MRQVLIQKAFGSVVLAAHIAVFVCCLAGCGGGGGGNRMLVTGAVSDIEGNLVPNASVTITGGGSDSKTSFNGAFKLTPGESGWQTLKATVVIDGHTWRGTQAVQVFSDGPTTNVNMVVGQSSKLGTISGRVRDSGGFGIEGVRVYVSTTYGSAVDLTDSSGDYRIDDLPASVAVDTTDQVVTYVMTASKVGFLNQTRSKDDGDNDISVSAGGTKTIDFVLNATTGSPVEIPSPWTIGVTAWTFPNSVTRSASAYDAVRAKVDQPLLRALGKRITTRSPQPGSIIEIDVTWFDSWSAFLQDNFGGSPPDNLAGFAIYRRIGSQPTSSNDRLYFDRQPLLTDFFDASPDLTSGFNYFYRITALNTNYLDSDGAFVPESESAFSSSASATPLDQLQETTPFNNSTQSTLTPVVFTWAPVGRAQSYKLYIYDQFPEMIDTGTTQPFPDQVVQPVAEVGPVTSTSTTAPGLSLNPGTTYYWIVIGADTDDFVSASAYSMGELRKFTAQ
jgi:hypothetical protein